MATDKYDLHTIDYSVQGWDSILATDMEKLDDVIPTRIFVTLGESVSVYQALYQSADSKWYKAQADGTKQPAFGVACENGVLNDSIRLHRMGEIINTGWTWADIGSPIYLSSTTLGALTQVRPSSNVQVVGYALSATKMLVIVPGDAGGLTKDIFDANTILKADVDDTPIILTVPVQTIVGRITAGAITALTSAQVLTLLNVIDGADVTGNNPPQAHKASHQDAGSDEISVAGLSGLLADDQHVLDAEVLDIIGDRIICVNNEVVCINNNVVTI